MDEALPVTPNPKGRRSKKAKLKVLNSKDRPTRLPPSLPVYRSSLYYGKSRRVEIIDLEEPEKIPIVYASDIILTDRLVLSDIKISFQGNVELRCNPGDLLENFEFVRLPTTAEYTILQPLDKVTPEKNLSLYPYRIVGVASVYDEKKIKIKECSSYLNRDQIFVPSGIINAIKTKKSSAEVATIIGGPTVYEQVNYAQAQYVYVNMGTLGFDQGQLFGIKSSKLDRVVGQIRILDRFGSYGLAIITEAANAIRAGDTIVSQ